MKFLSYLLISCLFIFTATSLNLHLPHFHAHKRGKKTHLAADLVLAGTVCATTAVTWSSMDVSSKVVAVASSVATCGKLAASVCDYFQAINKKAKALEEKKRDKEALTFVLSRLQTLENDLKGMKCEVTKVNAENEKLKKEVAALKKTS
ncbi:hypothetical protein K502DRAFT_332421 [Neoconidiobolus thromboides FSU 785]|nr:hypothetical protein K502DRAFT_332421 [Neoconidiobolus thromboides FSU 785]